MKKCDPRAYVACAYKSDCGPLGEAEYADGSECEQFNEEMVSRPLTNADRIRTMSDEELAKVLSSPCIGCVVKGCKLHNYGSYGCDKAFLKWLQQPVEEGSGNAFTSIKPGQSVKVSEIIGNPEG